MDAHSACIRWHARAKENDTHALEITCLCHLFLFLSFSLLLQLTLSEDRVHELTSELSAAKAAQQSAETRAATHMDQVAKQKHALQEAHQAQMQDKERQIRAMRIIQLLSKR